MNNNNKNKKNGRACTFVFYSLFFFSLFLDHNSNYNTTMFLTKNYFQCKNSNKSVEKLLEKWIYCYLVFFCSSFPPAEQWKKVHHQHRLQMSLTQHSVLKATHGQTGLFGFSNKNIINKLNWILYSPRPPHHQLLLLVSIGDDLLINLLYFFHTIMISENSNFRTSGSNSSGSSGYGGKLASTAQKDIKYEEFLFSSTSFSRDRKIIRLAVAKFFR